MSIHPKSSDTYAKLLHNYELEKQANKPKTMKGYIERNNQPPIHAFLNVSIRNHQNIPTRVGHISLSLLTPIQLDILAWADEQPKTPRTMNTLRDELILDLVHVADTRVLKTLESAATAQN